MSGGMFFEQGYWTANQSTRRRLCFMGSALLWLVIPIADLATYLPPTETNTIPEVRIPLGRPFQERIHDYVTEAKRALGP